MTGISLGTTAWGLVTGVAMVNGGLGVPLSLLMSLTVFAGSAQLAAVPLIVAGAPVWMVWATALCLNLRFVIFSAGWRRYFGRLPRAQRLALMYFAADLNYVVFMRRFPEPDAAPLDDQLAYYAGSVAMNATTWHLASIAGIVLAAHIPTEWGIGFAGTLALLGLTYSMLGDRTTWVPAIVAGAVAVAAAALPLKLNIVLAIATATAVGIAGDRGARRLLPARAGDRA
jgi:predicted branched-subunit amino acid permease